jgi:hypothetical protein
MRNLQRAVQLLLVHGQLHLVGQHPLETNRDYLLGSHRLLFESMLQQTLLLELFDEGGVHVQIYSRVVSWEIYVVVFGEDFMLDRDGEEDEAEVRVRLEVADVAHVQPPSDLAGEFVVRQIELLQRRVGRKYHVFLEGFRRRIVD